MLNTCETKEGNQRATIQYNEEAVSAGYRWDLFVIVIIAYALIANEHASCIQIAVYLFIRTVGNMLSNAIVSDYNEYKGKIIYYSVCAAFISLFVTSTFMHLVVNILFE